MASNIENMQRERDEAQSACAAWRDVFLSIEAHLQDRINMGDQASPETYLAIIRGSVANVDRDSEQIVASRWHDYSRQAKQIETLEVQVSSLLAALKEILPWHDSHPAEATDNRIINLCRAAIAAAEGAAT